MSEFIKVLLSLSFSGSLLLLFLLLFKPLYKHTFSKTWQYYIYLIVALRFLLPITLHNEITITGYITEKIQVIKNKHTIMKNQKNTGKEIQENNLKINKPKKNSEKKIASKTGIQQKENKQKNDIIHKINTISYDVFLFFLWLVIAVILFLRKVVLYQQFIHQLQKERTPILELEILNLFADCEEKVKIKKVMEIYQTSFLSSPIMIGFFYPKIMLSFGEYKKEELFYIFLHELIHYKRRDMFYKWLIQLVICIHWFNPFVYLLGKEVNKACELSCDEAVICLLGEKEKEAYGNVLVEALKKENVYKNSSAFLPFTEDVKQIKERLGAIMEYKKKTNIIKGMTGIFTMIICICFSTIGVYASGNKVVVSENRKEATPKKEKNKVNTEYDEITVYKREGFFCNSYVIEMAWNINKKDRKNTAKETVTLEDKSEMTVYFSKEAKEYKKDKEALLAIKETIYNIKNTSFEQFPPIEIPYICRIDYVPLKQREDAARNYYKEEDIIGFSAIFSSLDLEERKNYYKKMYEQDRIDFFLCSVKEDMDKDSILTYVKKSIKDDKIDIFSILIDALPSKERKKCVKKEIEKFYETDDYAWFSVCLDSLSNQEIKTWLHRAKKDKNEAMYQIISDEKGGSL